MCDLKSKPLKDTARLHTRLACHLRHIRWPGRVQSPFCSLQPQKSHFGVDLHRICTAINSNDLQITTIDNISYAKLHEDDYIGLRRRRVKVKCPSSSNSYSFSFSFSIIGLFFSWHAAPMVVSPRLTMSVVRNATMS